MPTAKRRIYELDLLRGFFICVVILDHLQFWPSPFQYLTGQGRLWVSAAEGFFLVSGLLVGYLRAYKGAKTPMSVISKGLVFRAFTLYLWFVGITLLVNAIAVLLPASNLMPKYPEYQFVTSLPTYIFSIFSGQYVSDWIYFLRLYAILLAITPLFLYLIRKGYWYIGALLSVITYIVSLTFGLEEAALQWQVFFFGAALIGWKLEDILAWLRNHWKLRTMLITGLITVTISTMILSYFLVHGWDYVESPAAQLSRESYVSIRASVDPLFSNNPMMPLRVGLAFIWFAGLLALFHIGRNWLMKYLGWLLLPFGQASLTVYIIQAVVLSFVVTLVPYTNSFWLNGFIGVLVLLLFAALLKIPKINRAIPR